MSLSTLYLVVDFDLEGRPAADEAADLGARDLGGDALRQVPIARLVASCPAVLDVHLHRHDVKAEFPDSGESPEVAVPRGDDLDVFNELSLSPQISLLILFIVCCLIA